MCIRDSLKLSIIINVPGIKAELEELAPPGALPGTSDPTIAGYENFLKRYSCVLHPNHVLLVDAKYTLAKMYGRMPGFEPDVLTDDQFKRKQNLCEEVLAVLNKIVPGRMRKRGKYAYLRTSATEINLMSYPK